MTTDGDMRETLGGIVATLENHGKELSLLRQEVKALGVTVAQHRTGWKMFCWLGGAFLATAAVGAGFIRD